VVLFLMGMHVVRYLSLPEDFEGLN
jgi:hypothetical protein